jgi:succinoglycan biosynthesis protein ExoA
MVIVSAVCPVLNEGQFIKGVIEFFLSAAPSEKELYIVDGGSTDNTVEIAQEYVRGHSNVYLLHNPQKYVPYSMNKAIPLCKGDFIVRLDAHTTYDISYFTEIIETFKRTGASIVGGPMVAVGVTPAQKAIAYATSTSFGIGNSSFHFSNFEGEADSVYLGAWRKSIFDMTGLFDVRFLRNQDDEFHYRAKSLGFKIWLNPKIKSFYYPRSSIAKLWIQYYQYGLYKPRVLAKIRSMVQWRHLVPSFFLLYLILMPLFIMGSGGSWIIEFLGLTPAVLYFIMDVSYSIQCRYGILPGIICLVIYPTLHLSYGLGFLVGVLKLFKK